MKYFILFLLFVINYQLGIAQKNVGIGTANPQAQLHTTGTVRHEILKGNGQRLVYANDSGNLVTKQVSSNNAIFNIPDATCTGVSSVITISGQPNAIASSLVQVSVNISHPADNNLVIYLTSPAGQTLILSNQHGGSAANFFNTVFADNAAAPITAGIAPFSGSYKPAGSTSSICLNTTITSFAAFGGGSIVPNGNWTLKVADVTAGDTGTLISWSVSFDGSEPVAANIPLNYVPKANSNGVLIKGTMYDNGNIGIGTNAPAEKLSVGGNLLVKQPVVASESQPDAAHTITLLSFKPVQADSLFVIDSVYRILDAGGRGNYAANDTAAFILVDTTGTAAGNNGLAPGLQLSFDSIYMAPGDSLYVLTNNVIGLRGGSNLNGTMPSFSGNNIFVYYGTLPGSPTAPGFSAVVRRLYADKKAAGAGANTDLSNTTSLYFNSLTGSFKAGVNTAAPGNGAFALGSNSYAQGRNAGALGAGSNAYGDSSFALSGGYCYSANTITMGKSAYADANGAIAIGGGSARGENSMALMKGYTYGAGSLAIGTNSYANGANSVSLLGGSSAGVYSLAAGQGANTSSSNTDGVAIGNGSNSSGNGSIALGYHSGASGTYAVGIGYNSYSYGMASVALGNSSAGGSYTTAMGSSSASGTYATAMGNSTASGQGAVAAGLASASAAYAVAIGNNVTANGAYSMALGNYCTTSSHIGCLTIGDNSTTTIMQTYEDNAMRARFAKGFRFFTTKDVTIGAFLNQGANSWAALSDRRLKENFLPVNGELFLKKIAAMPLTTWNYIGQDVKTFRHYGPMAQDFFAAFGKDELGAIGCDTLINQQDFLGVSLIAIQALEKRTNQLTADNGQLKTVNEQLRWKNEQLEARLQKLEAVIFKQ